MLALVIGTQALGQQAINHEKQQIANADGGACKY
jgi:hypothetical protein